MSEGGDLEVCLGEISELSAALYWNVFDFITLPELNQAVLLSVSELLWCLLTIIIKNKNKK